MAHIVFSHANGFPAGTYRQIFEIWRAAGHVVQAIDRIGHNPAHPVTSNWPHLRDELIARLRQAAEPVHLVGHSLGGYVSLLVAHAEPALVRSVVLLDSPVVTGWRAKALHAAKATGWVGRVSPGRVSQRRRAHWPDPSAAWHHFAAKPAFARWAPGVLQDYVDCGMQPDSSGSGVCLAFDRNIETRIYNTLPHHLGGLLRQRAIKCPVGFIGGTHSNEVRQVGMAATQALTRGRIEWVAGSHLFPMESPRLAAEAALRLLG